MLALMEQLGDKNNFTVENDIVNANYFLGVYRFMLTVYSTEVGPPLQPAWMGVWAVG